MKIKYSVWYVAGFRPSAEAEVAQINCNWPKAFLLQDKNRIGPNKNFPGLCFGEVIGRPTTNIQSRHKAPRCTSLIPLKLLSIPFCSVLLPFTSPPQIDNRSYPLFFKRLPTSLFLFFIYYHYLFPNASLCFTYDCAGSLKLAWLNWPTM